MRKGLILILTIAGVVLFISLFLFYVIFINRTLITSGPLGRVLPKSTTGSCPPGLYDYGVPLGCVSKEVIEKCKQQPCPICLASNTAISTPYGNINVKNLKEGMLVWSVDKKGQKILSRIAKLTSVYAPKTHKVLDLGLEDGREIWVSPNHPTTQGFSVGELKIGDTYDGSRIVKKVLIPYWEDKIYDLLPDSDTGYYFANGMLLGSSLK